MLLTKKAFIKALVMAICYFLIGCFSFGAATLGSITGEPNKFMWILGIIMCFMSIPVYFLGRVSEGKAKIVKQGIKLVRNQLKPAEFIDYYENLKNSEDLVVNKPCLEVLQMVATAYESLNDKENEMLTINEMIKIASGKKKNVAYIWKCSCLYDIGNFQEAELIFNEIQKQKLNFIEIPLVDAVLKSDRAFAMEDYKTVEAYNLKALEQTFPKPDNLAKLLYNYKLGEVYEKLGEKEKTIFHFQYCVDNGGETAIRKSAMEKIQ